MMIEFVLLSLVQTNYTLFDSLYCERTRRLFLSHTPNEPNRSQCFCAALSSGQPKTDDRTREGQRPLSEITSNKTFLFFLYQVSLEAARGQLLLARSTIRGWHLHGDERSKLTASENAGYRLLRCWPGLNWTNVRLWGDVADDTHNRRYSGSPRNMPLCSLYDGHPRQYALNDTQGLREITAQNCHIFLPPLF